MHEYIVRSVLWTVYGHYEEHNVLISLQSTSMLSQLLLKL